MQRLGSSVYEKGPGKRTSQGKRRNVKKSSMNKAKKRSFKRYNGQGRP